MSIRRCQGEAVQRSNWTTHYNDGHRLNPGIPDEVLEEYDWPSLNCLAEDTAFILVE